jgi:Cutinase
MALSNSKVALLSLLASTVSAMPSLLGTEHMPVSQVQNLTMTIDAQMLAAFECEGQSCLIADTAGSTGHVPNMKAEGATDQDIACIVKYNPEIGEYLQKYKNRMPEVPKQDTGVMSNLMGGLNKIWRGFAGDSHTGSFTGTCAPNVLIFSKGTLEPGQYGITVGPIITSGLPSDWSTYPVVYDADVPGDYCLGLPGGMVAKDIINEAAKKCPNSKLFVSGYSQGAMVVRNGLARASDFAKSRVKVRLIIHSTFLSK